MNLPFRILDISPETPKARQVPSIAHYFRADTCGFFLCQEGWTDVKCEERTLHLEPGDVFIYALSPTVKTLDQAPGMRGVVVEGNLDFVLPVVNRVINSNSIFFIRSNPKFTFTPEQCRRMEFLIRALQAGRPADRLEMELAKSVGHTLILELLHSYFANMDLEPRPQTRKEHIFQHFHLDLYKFYKRRRDVAFYADRQNLSVRYFSSIVKQCSGHTPLELISQLVVSDAQQMLETTQLSVKEIAQRLHFPTQTFFSKYFKQYVGVSPRDYRRHLAEGSGGY